MRPSKNAITSHSAQIVPHIHSLIEYSKQRSSQKIGIVLKGCEMTECHENARTT